MTFDLFSTTTVVFCAVLFLAAMLQSLAGFGFGLTALMLLALFLDPIEASVLVTISALVLAVFVTVKLRSHFRWERVSPHLVGATFGVPIGVLLLMQFGSALIVRWLGAILILTALQRFFKGREMRPWHPYFLGIPSGFLAGLSSGAVGAGGPPSAAYISTQRFDRARMLVSMHLIFTLNSGLRIVELLRRDMIAPDLLPVIVIGTAFVLLGSIVGMRLSPRVPDRHLQTMVSLLLLLFGIRYLFFA